MSKWEKLIRRLLLLSGDFRYEELKKVLEHYGYRGKFPKGGSSHVTFRKDGHIPLTIPIHGIIKKAYVEDVRDVAIEEEGL